MAVAWESDAPRLDRSSRRGRRFELWLRGREIAILAALAEQEDLPKSEIVRKALGEFGDRKGLHFIPANVGSQRRF